MTQLATPTDIPLETDPAAEPRLLPAPTEPPSGHRSEQRAKRRRRSWTAWFLLVAVLGGAGYGGYRLVEQRLASASQLELESVVLTATPIPVGSPDAAVVTTLDVAPGQSVAAGAELATIRLTSASGGDELVTLSAPGAGTVVSVDAQPGSVVRAGESVVTLYDPAMLTFRTELPVDEVADVSMGMVATISGPGLERPVQATVDRVLPVIDGAATSTTLTLVLVPVDPTQVAQLVPGVPLTGTLDTTSGTARASVLDTGA